MQQPDIFYYTVSAREITAFMPRIPVLLSAASFLRHRTTGRHLIPPRLPTYIAARGADSGGFVAATRWGGRYRFRPADYLHWLFTFRPQWALTMDLACLDRIDSRTVGYPGKQEVRRRQHFTTEMAYRFWDCYRDVPWNWCVPIQGFYAREFEDHARELAPLLHKMCRFYLDQASSDDEQEACPCAFRVGVGSLCRNLSPSQIAEIIARIQEVLGLMPLHLLGTKLRFLKLPVAWQQTISVDSSVWNGLWGVEHESRRASGLSVTEYSWQVGYPRYAAKVQAALNVPRQRLLPFPDRKNR